MSGASGNGAFSSMNTPATIGVLGGGGQRNGRHLEIDGLAAPHVNYAARGQHHA